MGAAVSISRHFVAPVSAAQRLFLSPLRGARGSSAVHAVPELFDFFACDLRGCPGGIPNFTVDLIYQRVVWREPKLCHDVIDDLSHMLVIVEVAEAAARMEGGVHYSDDIGGLFAISHLVPRSTISRPLARSRSVICLA
jgi:hypothetical protein